MSDRRIYIHEQSFHLLASDFPDIASEVYGALGLGQAARIARHQLVASGEDLGLVRRGTFEPAVAQFERLAHKALTGLFRHVTLAPPERSREAGTVRLLGLDEMVVASCAESGYLTFATGPRSTAAMYEDTGSLRGLRRDIRSNPERFPDLTVINGHNLFVYDPGISVGPATVPLYVALRHPSYVSPASALDSVLDGLRGVLATVADGEARVLADTCARTVNSSVGALLQRVAGPARSRLVNSGSPRG